MNWAALIGDYAAFLQAEGLSEATIALRRTELRHVVALLGRPPDEVGADDLITVLATQPWCSETRRSYALVR